VIVSNQIRSTDYPAITPTFGRATRWSRSADLEVRDDSCLTTHPQNASEIGQASRLISNGQLNVLLRLHSHPIYVVVYHEPLGTCVQGDLILRRVSRLDAFSVSPVRT
jgi:hypothetical protein